VKALVLALGIVASSCAQHKVEVYDGFETPTLSGVWETDRMERRSLTMQSEIVRAGHSAAKIVLRSRDTFEAGVNGSKDTERDELREASRLVSKEGVTYEFAFSQYLPPNFPILATRLVLAQWKQACNGHAPCDDDSPVVALRFSSGVFQITLQTGKHREPVFETRDEIRGRWIDYRFQIRFTPTNKGFLRAWRNGTQVVNYQGPTAYPENEATGYDNPSRFYFKMGLYRDLMPEPMTLYLDEYRKRQLPD
jgi:hypothetical protein